MKINSVVAGLSSKEKSGLETDESDERSDSLDDGMMMRAV